MNVLGELRERFRKALTQAASQWDAFDLAGTGADDRWLDDLLTLVRPAQNAQFGDYQANMAMSLGKRLGQSPRDVAQSIIDHLDVADVCDPPEVAGPGFINLRLQDAWLLSQLERARRDGRLGCPPVDDPETYIVDYSSPNVAKPLHVGHIRSTVIGDALSRILRFQGHQVISDNHLGDWGTQFGMIIYGYQHFVDPVAYQAAPIDELGRLYRLVRRLMDAETDAAESAARQAACRQAEQQFQELEAAGPPDAASEAKKWKKARSRARTHWEEARAVLGIRPTAAK